jgi:hypothetical protein
MARNRKMKDSKEIKSHLARIEALIKNRSSDPRTTYFLSSYIGGCTSVAPPIGVERVKDTVDTNNYATSTSNSNPFMLYRYVLVKLRSKQDDQQTSHGSGCSSNYFTVFSTSITKPWTTFETRANHSAFTPLQRRNNTVS